MSNIYVKGNAGTEVIFDFDKGYVQYFRTGSVNRILGIIDVDIPFDEITGFVLKKPSILLAGRMHIIVNNTIPFASTGNDSNDCSLTEIAIQSSAYKQLEQAIQKFCESVKKVPIYDPNMITAFNKNGNVNINKVKYTQRNNPYETESKEYHRRCNVCGHIYCFTKTDFERNSQARKSATMSTVGELAGALSGNWGASIVNSQNSNNEINKIIDFSKCPKCNSTNISDLTEEEFKALSKQSVQTTTSSVSSADELKKFKELLDMGVITQEEFDAKKKQLLGL